MKAMSVFWPPGGLHLYGVFRTDRQQRDRMLFVVLDLRDCQMQHISGKQQHFCAARRYQ
jgi:hypothetical protein